MNEKFSTLLLESLKDGSYNVGLRDKISSIRLSAFEAQESNQEYNIDELGDSLDGSDKIRENAKKWATTIYHDSTLSRSHGDPYYYPPVPLDGEDIITRDTNKIIKKNTFIDDNVIVSSSPLYQKDMDMELAGLDAIDPNILCRTDIKEVDIDIIIGHFTTPNFRFPIIMNCVGYMVHIFLDSRTNREHLSHIYVYKNHKMIMDLLDFLKDLQVENIEDLEHSKKYLQQLSFSS